MIPFGLMLLSMSSQQALRGIIPWYNGMPREPDSTLHAPCSPTNTHPINATLIFTVISQDQSLCPAREYFMHKTLLQGLKATYQFCLGGSSSFDPCTSSFLLLA